MSELERCFKEGLLRKVKDLEKAKRELIVAKSKIDKAEKMLK